MAEQTTTNPPIGNPPISDADRARIAARYPQRHSGRVLSVIGLVVLLGLVSWTVWAGLSKATPGISGQLFTYKVVDDARIDVTLRVHRPDPTKPGTCTIQAQAPNGETVAELDVAVPPSDQKDVAVPASLKTYLRAHTAILTGCTLT